ncbi:MAG: glycosyltransferase [Acidobacteria bacterium]|nr:glycosyltransferase [Acidobacteriota bacterium]
MSVEENPQEPPRDQETRSPAITVIIAAFNAEDTLGEQLGALARQDSPFDWEVLVCDNGSTDGTADLVRAWAHRLPQLKLVDASIRRGPSAARNVGAQAARSALLAFCDADDIVADDWLLEMQRALQDSELVAGRTVPLPSPGAVSVSWAVDGLIVMPYWPLYPSAASSNLGVHSSVFRDLDGFDESLRSGEDIDFCWRAQMRGSSLEQCASAVVHIRKRTGLRSVYRQAFSYAVGEIQLKRKHADAMAAYVPSPAGPAEDGVPTRIPSRPSFPRRAFRILQPDGRADAAWRFGGWLGRRWASAFGARSP